MKHTGIITTKDLLKIQQRQQRALKLIVKKLRTCLPDAVAQDITNIANKALKETC